MHARVSASFVALALFGCSADRTADSDTNDAGAPASQAGPRASRAARRALRDGGLPLAAKQGDPSATIASARAFARPFEALSDPRAPFAVRQRRATTYFTDSGFAMSVPAQGGRFGLHATLVGANAMQPAAESPSRTRTSAGTRTIASFDRLAWDEVYEGIDLVVAPAPDGFEYAFVASPEADLARVKLAWSGATAVRLRDAGRTAEVETPVGVARITGLRAYEVIDGVRHERAARHVADALTLGVEVDGWTRRGPLVIDPAVTWSTFLGGSADDTPSDVAVDASGNVVIAGTTSSSDFPTTAGLDTSAAGTDAFVSMLSSSGALVWSTYLGGAGVDVANGVAIGPGGVVFVTGTTRSGDFPVKNAAYPTHGGTTFGDAFVTKLAANGTVLWSTFLGGASSDAGYGVAADASGDVFVVGATRSAGFPIAGAIQPAHPDVDFDAFVTKLSPTGGLLWSTFYGGPGYDDTARAVAVDAAGNVVVAGETSAPNFPTKGAYDATYGGVTDAFVTKINAAGTAVTWSTLFGGGAADRGLSVAIDAAGSVVLAGSTTSTALPTTAGFQKALLGSYDAFVAKLRADGAALTWSTYLGGSQDELTAVLALTAGGDVFVVGSTSSADFPSAGGFQPAPAGGLEAFVARITSAGALRFGSYLGGASDDEATGVAVDAAGNALVVGHTTSAGFPVTAAYDATYGAPGDGFVVKLPLPDRALAGTCASGSECASGRCIDGVCCDRACGGCEACTAAKKGSGADGTCGAVAAGSDPNGACAADAGFPASCKADGNCNGSGACRTVAPSGTSCAAQACSAGVQSSARACDAAGSCVAATTLGCGAYACSGASCGTTCSGDPQCAVGSYCAGSACVTKMAQGAACLAANECASGQCVDGVCCDVACAGKCTACSAAKKGKGVDGVCEAIVDGNDPDDECAGDACVSGTFNRQVCDGAGACRAMATSCGTFGCNAAGTACANSCASDVDCGVGAFCDAASTCQPKLPSGHACARRAECAGSAFCVDGVCCETACTRSCEACNVAGREGTCVPVVGAPHAGHPPCKSDGTACAGACDGVTGAVCAYPTTGTNCGEGCKDGKLSVCDGAGVCLSAAACAGNLACDGATRCKAACAVDADCLPGFLCTDAKCAPKPAATCSADRTISTATDGSGAQRACAPYLCSSSGECLETCSKTDDCAAGYTCDLSKSPAQCVPSTEPATAASGGCALGAERSSRSAALVGAVLSTLALLRRRRPRRRSNRVDERR